jgi:hypothetical protein
MMQNEDVSILHHAIFDRVSDVVATRHAPHARTTTRSDTRSAGIAWTPHRFARSGGRRFRRPPNGRALQGSVTVTSSNETTASVAVSAMPPLVTDAFIPEATTMPSKYAASMGPFALIPIVYQVPSTSCVGNL